MADFKAAFERTMSREGGYVFDPDDAGGETYKGIARRFHPSWDGWEIVDEIKRFAQADLADVLDDNDTLQERVAAFYRAQFWNRFMGDAITDQRVAEELFDTAVNMGVHRAVTFLQRALNLLNRGHGQALPRRGQE